MSMLLNCSDIRRMLAESYAEGRFVTDKTGVNMVEIIAATFLADEPTIVGKPSREYIEREIEWYKSMSLSIYHIPPPVPEIWKSVADKNGRINSNYGYLIWSNENHDQYGHVLRELQANPFSRRAEMIYTRPSIWNEFDRDGMSDFICTDAVQYFIREGALQAHVRMRSNDGVWGYKNDYFWQKFVLHMLAEELQVPEGNIIWTSGSFHIYERHFYLIDNFIKTGEIFK